MDAMHHRLKIEALYLAYTLVPRNLNNTTVEEDMIKMGDVIGILGTPTALLTNSIRRCLWQPSVLDKPAREHW